MLLEASLTSEINKTNKNRFVLKSFFRITHLLVKQNWAHTHSLKNVVDLVAERDGKELQTHLLTVSKNATYISPVYVAKYIDIMNEYLKAPLLASLRTGKCTRAYSRNLGQRSILTRKGTFLKKGTKNFTHTLFNPFSKCFASKIKPCIIFAKGGSIQ